jgi:hypothetical protein
VAVDGCGDRNLELALLDAAGTTTLASATNGVGAAPCVALTHTITEPGSYAIRVA